MGKIVNRDRRFCDIMPLQVLDELNEFLCRRLGAPPGTDILFWDTQPIEKRGAVKRAFLRAEWRSGWLDFTMDYVNAGSEMHYGEDRRPEYGKIDLGNAA